MDEGSSPGEERKDGNGLRFPMSKTSNSPSDLFIKKGVDFDRVKRRGQRLQTPHFNLVFVESPHVRTRLGIIVGRRFGKAVLRNRAKRVFRELARTTRIELVGGKEFLIFPKRKALQSSHGTVREAWRVTLTEAGLLDPCYNS
jgi:ribonuclease P protein component